MEVLYGVGMFFPIHKKIYRSIAIISAILMIYVLCLGNSSYSTDLLLIKKFKYDSISVVIIMTICSIIGHTYITLTRKEKDILYNKFIDIGKNSAFILHDFKGMLSTPIIYTKLINENIKNQDFTKASKNLTLLESDLMEIEKYAKEINKITLPGSRLKKEEFYLSQSVDSLKILLNKYLSNVDLIVSNDQKITADQCSILKILYNLTINSIDQFRKNGQIDCNIIISIENNFLIFKDNGLGYHKTILNKLNTNTLSIESNTGNSGLGLQIVAGIAKELNMKLIFFNDNGAGVKIKL
jgi:signal transduction histidine kinase